MQAFFLSHFNFCLMIWHYCSMRDLRKIEKLQNNALKYVYNDFKSLYTDLRKMANRPLMYIERQRCILLEVFKCLNQICPRYLRDMFEIKVIPYNLCNKGIVIMPKYTFIIYIVSSLIPFAKSIQQFCKFLIFLSHNFSKFKHAKVIYP